MPGRTVAASLDLNVQGYIAGMAKAAAATSRFASQATAAIDKNSAGLNDLTRGAGLFGAAALAGTALAVKGYADFDSAVSSVAATGQDARANLSALREEAVASGAATKYSATEAAGGLESLAKAGVTSRDSLGGGLKGALDLAAAGNLGVAESAEVAATAMTQFRLSGRDVPRIADLIAAGAGKAQGEVSDMAMALKQGGLVASQFDLSIEETVGSLAAFASAGLVGSDSGTAFKTMLLQLANPSREAAATMQRLGITAYDAQGQFVGITDLAGQLQSKMSDLSPAVRDAALAQIFGNDAVRAANVLYEQGSQGISGWISQVSETGYAAEVARTKMNNLRGDLELLRGAGETALIGLGEGGDGPLRALVQMATEGINAFSDLGDGAQATLLAIGAGLGIVALGAAGLGKVAIFAAEAKAALAALGVTARGASLAVAGVGAAIGVAALAFGVYASSAAASRARVDSFTEALQSQNDAIQENVTKVAAKQLQDAGALSAARQLGLSLDDVTAASLGNADALARVNAVTSQYDGANKNLARGLGDVDTKQIQLGMAARTLSSAIGTTGSEYNKAVQNARDFSAATDGATSSTQTGLDAYTQAGSALEQLASESQSASQSLDDLVASMFAAGSAAISLSDAQIGYESAVAAAADAAERNGRNLKLSTEAGRENRTALNRLGTESQRYIEQLIEQGKSTGRVVGATRDARAEFVRVATAMTGSKDKAQALADKYGLIPKDVKTKVTAPGAKQAKAEADEVDDAIRGLPKDTQTRVKSAFERGGIEAARRELAAIDGATATTYIRTVRSVVAGRTGPDEAVRSATGGYIRGPGTTTSDSIPALLSDKEYVQNAAATAFYGVGFMDALNARQIPKDALPRYAGGGYVGYAGGGQVLRAQTTDVYTLIRALQSPLAQIAASVRNLDNRRIAATAARRVLGAAGRDVDDAEDTRDRLKNRVDRLAKLARATKGVTAVDRELADARVRLRKSNEDLDRQEQRRARALDRSRDADRKATDAAQALAQAQKQLADEARRVSDQFADQYRSTSTDVQDWLTLMREGTGDLSKFRSQVARLRKSGLSETLVQQIIGSGAGAGGETAAQILAGGSGLVRQLNSANTSLQSAADALGYLAGTGRRRMASGGPVVGPGSGTSDSVAIMASNGEWVVPEHAVAANRPWLEQITYGRQVVSHNYARTHYAAGGPVHAPLIDMDALAKAVASHMRPIENHQHFPATPNPEALAAAAGARVVAVLSAKGVR